MSSSEIQVWPIFADVSDRELLRFGECLSEDERERAARFRFEKDRRPYVVCRGALRMLVEGYSGISAVDVRFAYSDRGKPRLSGETDLRFNVSHSGNLGILAFARGCELGVDVERVQPLEGMDEIARHFFCAEEWQELMLLPAEKRERAFFRCWTRKEAFIKATGEGLTTPLDQFQVTIKEGEAARFVHIDHVTDEASQWKLEALALTPGYEGAVAYRGESKRFEMAEAFPASTLTEGK